MILTPAQNRVALLAAAGLPRAELARQLGISLSTVDKHMHAIYRRTNVRSRRELAAVLVAGVDVRPLWQTNRYGWRIGDAVAITGGRFAGRTGTYAGSNNTTQIRVRIGGGTFAIRAWYVQRLECTN